LTSSGTVIATRKLNPMSRRVRGLNTLKGRTTYCKAASRALLNGVLNRGRRPIFMRFAKRDQRQNHDRWSNQGPVKAFFQLFQAAAEVSSVRLRKWRQPPARRPE